MREESTAGVFQNLREFENLYHCGECRMVFCLEEEDRKITDRCPNCGPGTFWKMT